MNYKRQYDIEDYRRKLGDLLNIENNTPQRNGYSNNSSTLILSTSKERRKKRQPTPYHSTTSKKSLDNDDFDSPKNINLSNRKVRFSDRIEYKEIKSVKRLPTPYRHLKNKKFRGTTTEIEKNVLFPSQPTDSSESNDEEAGNISEELMFSPSLSEFSDCNEVKNVFNKKKRKNRIPKDIKRPTKKMSSSKTNIKASEIVCNTEKYQRKLYDANCPITEESFSEAESSDSSDLQLKSDINSNAICDDFSATGNDNVELSDLAENDDSSENTKSESNDEEICGNEIVRSKDLELREKFVGNVEYYSVNNKLVIVLHNNTKLYLHGLISVDVLFGAVEVLGYTLTKSSVSAEIFSPRGSSFLYFETKGQADKSNIQDLDKSLSKIRMENNTVTALCQKIALTSAVILCKNIVKSEIEFLEKHTSQQVFPKNEHPLSQCILQNKIGSWSVFQPSIEWDSLADSVKSTSKLFICGGKSVGKSTMLRYIINKLLLKHPEILVIDLDPGQPEFTVSGCISATIVKEPVFGPNYTHLRQPSRCFFIPNINISYQPDGYLTSVKELINSCSDLPKIPVIINYMGFTRGLGLEIFSAVVAYVQPTSVVEVQSKSSKRNFKKELTYELISERSKLLASKVDYIQKFTISTIESMADANEGWHLEPRQIREMSVLSYLSKALPQHVLSLTDSKVPVFAVDLSQITIICNGEVINPSIVNANLVALCSTTSGSSYTCYGWGVVRGINLTTNELYLLTPVSVDELEQVDHLILGSVSLPPSLYMTSDNNKGLVPYVSQGLLTTLGQIPKRSHLPPRNKQD